MNKVEVNGLPPLRGQTALVTGASRGIGLAICESLALAGADIAAVARTDASLEQVRDLVHAAGRTCLAISADLADEAAPIDAAEKALTHFGTVDILINNAGVAAVAPLVDTSVAQWNEVLAVNLRAPFLLAKTVAPQMIAQRRGKVINISSQAGVVGLEDHSAYCASKSGMNGLTKAMTSEWGRFNIQCIAVCPTVILTPMGAEVWGRPEVGDPMKAKIPAGRFGLPSDVADLVTFLASPAADMINGDTIMLDGGYTAL